MNQDGKANTRLNLTANFANNVEDMTFWKPYIFRRITIALELMSEYR